MVDRIAGDRPGSLFIQALDDILKRERAEADEVRAEIKQKGTHWAGDEIWKLRRHVASLQERLARGDYHDGERD